MRLIDADKLTKQIAGMAFANNYPVNKVLALCKLIDSQPTAFDIDKVVEHLESEFNNIPFQYKVNYEDGFSDGLLEAIKTVKAGGIDGN